MVVPAHWWEKVPAPLPPLLGLMAGILLGFGSGWGWPLGALGMVVAGLSRRYWLLVLVLLAGLLGQWREQAWDHAPNTLASYVGSNLALNGHWNGQFMALQDPPTQVALSPKPLAPPGTMTVRGVLTLPPGRRIPGGFDYAFWLKSQGVRTVLAGAAVKNSTPETGFRSWFRRGLVAGLPPAEAALMTAVELGDRNALGNQNRNAQDGAQNRSVGSSSVQDRFTHAGLAHLMALSEQNVALLVGLLTLVFVRTPLGRIGLWRYPLMMALLLGCI